MSPEKNPLPPPSCDESLYNLISNLWLFQGGNGEAIMHQEDLDTAKQSLETEKANLRIIVRIEIAASLILIGVSLLIHWMSRSDLVSVPVEAHKIQIQQRLPDKSD